MKHLAILLLLASVAMGQTGPLKYIGTIGNHYYKGESKEAPAPRYVSIDSLYHSYVSECRNRVKILLVGRGINTLRIKEFVHAREAIEYMAEVCVIDARVTWSVDLKETTPTLEGFVDFLKMQK